MLALRATSVFSSDAHQVYWLIYETLLVILFVIFLVIYHAGKSELRPYTHVPFTRLRIACVLALLFAIIWAFQFVFKHTQIVSVIFGCLSDAFVVVIFCFACLQIIHNYYGLQTQHTPLSITYYLYSWSLISLIHIVFQSVSYSIDNSIIDDSYVYCIYVVAVFNSTLLLLLFWFILLFIAWILVQHHKVKLFQESEQQTANAFTTPLSEISVGGENDATAQTSVYRLIGFLSGFCVYIGLLLTFNIYSLTVSDTASYDIYQIIIHWILEKLVLFGTLIVFLFPSNDDYLSVNPNIISTLDSLNIATESNRHRKSTFKDPNASDRWEFHAGHSADVSCKSEDGGNEYGDAQQYDDENIDLDDDQASTVSYTTLMFRKDQQKLAGSAPKARGWLSYFNAAAVSSSTVTADSSQEHITQDAGNDTNDPNDTANAGAYIEHDEAAQKLLLNMDVDDVPQARGHSKGKKKKRKKAARVKKSRYSQAEASTDNIAENSHSLRSMLSE